MSSVLINQTPLPAVLLPYRDHLLRSHVLVIAKATWRLSTGRLAAAEQQVRVNMQQFSICLGDMELDPVQRDALEPRLEEPVVWLDHDLVPPKPAFDVIVAGYATAPVNHPHAFIDCGVRIGTHVGSMRAYAPRYWYRGWLGYEARGMTSQVCRVPVTYALADWDSGCAIRKPGDADDTPAGLPWIESLNADSERRRHARVPAGLGFWPENATHRAIHAGTYDDVWKKKRAPDLPLDFNPRFYNSAHKDMQLARAPSAGTPIRLVHLARQAIVDCTFPAFALSVQARTASGAMRPPLPMTADTLVIEPEYDRLSLVFRALLPAGEETESVRTVRLFKSSSHAG